MKAIDSLKGQFEITNYYRFTNVNSFSGTWQLMEDNKQINSGTLTASDLDIPPLTSKAIAIGFGKPALKAGSKYWLNLSFKLEKNELWADAGYEIASEQFESPFAVPEAPMVDTLQIPTLSVNDSKDSIIVSNTNLQLVFDKNAGTISSFMYQGTKLLQTGPVPSFWRAPNSNDRGQPAAPHGKMPAKTEPLRD
jgi:beta-galactosidase